MFVDFIISKDTGERKALRVNPSQVAAFLEVSPSSTLIMLVGGKEFVVDEAAKKVCDSLEAAQGPILV